MTATLHAASISMCHKQFKFHFFLLFSFLHQVSFQHGCMEREKQFGIAMVNVDSCWTMQTIQSDDPRLQSIPSLCFLCEQIQQKDRLGTSHRAHPGKSSAAYQNAIAQSQAMIACGLAIQQSSQISPQSCNRWQ